MIDYENKYGIKNIQIELLELMRLVHKVCKDKHVGYSLCGGTLIGAVRENGFIQWDDDMDIMVSREQLNKLIKAIQASDNLSIDRELWVYRIRKKSDFHDKNFATIDIMVMDHVPDNKMIWKMKILIIKILQGMLKEQLELTNFSVFYKFALASTYYVGKIFPRSFKLAVYDSVSRIGNRRKTQYVAAYNDLFRCLDLRYHADVMDKLMVHKFENEYFMITELYDNYLTTQYGDYMTPPDDSERIPIHVSRADSTAKFMGRK